MLSNATEVLPQDVLEEVFLYLDPFDTSQKFRISSVSRFWRRSALLCSQLWATIRLRFPKDNAAILPTLLLRSGAARLHIEIDVASMPPTSKVLLNDVALQLSSHSRRISVLHLSCIGVSFNDFSPLVDDEKLSFLQLRDLRLRGPIGLWCLSNIRASRLVSLDLEHVTPARWSDLLSISTRKVRLMRSGVSSPIHVILQHAPRLVRFTVEGACKDIVTPDSLPAQSFLNLKSLCLHLDGTFKELPLFFKAIRESGIILHTWKLYFPHDPNSPYLHEGLEVTMTEFYPVTFDMMDNASFHVTDVDGRSRTIALSCNKYTSPEWFWTSVFSKVPTYHLRQFSVKIGSWSLLNVTPVPMTWPTLDELRIYGSSLNILSWESEITTADIVPFFRNGAKRVRFDVSDRAYTRESGSVFRFVVQYLRCLNLRALPEEIEVCLGDTPICQNEYDLPEILQDFWAYAQAAQPGKYKPCSHCLEMSATLLARYHLYCPL